MVRFKFLVFALVALGLWAAQLILSAPEVAARAVDQASLRALGAPSVVAARMLEQRAELTSAALKLAGDPKIAAALKSPGGRLEAPSAERFEALAQLVAETIPEGQKSAVVVGWINEAGATWSRGGGEVSTDTTELNLSDLSKVGLEVATQDAFGAPHFFLALAYLTPSGPNDRGELKLAGHLVLGVPVIPPNLAKAVADELRLSAVALLSAGASIDSAGGKKELLAAAATKTRPGTAGVIEWGVAQAIGPLNLPLNTSGDPLGGRAPLWVASRQEIKSTPYEVVALTSLDPSMQALAAQQKLSLMMLAGLLGLTLVWLLFMGSTTPPEVRSSNRIEVPTRPVERPAPPAEAGPEPAPPPLEPEPQPEPPPHEASPDDFHFPQSMETQKAISTTAETAVGGAVVPPPFDDQAPQPITKVGPDLRDTDANPPVPPPPNDPFAFAGPPPPVPEGALGADFNPDATRVASVPQELLMRTARPVTDFEPTRASAVTAPAAMPRVQPVAAPAASLEDQHFQDVFRDFLATRAKCGEPADGLTYDKFAAKLRKNREQIIAKHNCRTVRFQVYVKDGKAALKATPVKD